MFCVFKPRAKLRYLIKLKLKLSHYTPWRRFGESRYSSYSFSTSALDGGKWSASRPGRALALGKRTSGTHYTGGWVGPRAGLDTEARGRMLSPLPRIEPRSPGRPARSQTLYWLSYPAHLIYLIHHKNPPLNVWQLKTTHFVQLTVDVLPLCYFSSCSKHWNRFVHLDN
jgi:hypothetical protein